MTESCQEKRATVVWFRDGESNTSDDMRLWYDETCWRGKDCALWKPFSACSDYVCVCNWIQNMFQSFVQIWSVNSSAPIAPAVTPQTPDHRHTDAFWMNISANGCISHYFVFLFACTHTPLLQPSSCISKCDTLFNVSPKGLALGEWELPLRDNTCASSAALQDPLQLYHVAFSQHQLLSESEALNVTIVPFIAIVNIFPQVRLSGLADTAWNRAWFEPQLGHTWLF